MAKVFNRIEIKNILKETTPDTLIEYMEEAFTLYSSGLAVLPPVGTLTFNSPPGDMHIKYGYVQGDSHYVVKIASGFYENPSLGLSSSNGLNLVFSQKTGVLETILLDEGLLTDIRTAVAGAIVSKYLAPKKVKAIGIMGSGIQARLQLEYLKSVVDCQKVFVWGRSDEKLQAYKNDMTSKGYDIITTQDSRLIGRECNLIITTTPSTSPIFFEEDLQKGTHITAVGADTTGKQELDITILERANLIVLDSAQQCQVHGEIHKAFQKNLLVKQRLVELGEIISSGGYLRRDEDITIADLTGIATQDIQISKFILERALERE